MTKRLFPDNVKPCADCCQPFPLPAGMTRRRWLFQEACSACEPARLRDRVRANVEVDANGCWIWKGSCARYGYGQISVHDTPCAVHVVAFEAFKGPVPHGQEVCHSCDVRSCCNPEHLFAGTRQDNVDDMLAKGRGSKPPLVRGEAHGLAEATDEQVSEACRLRDAGVPQREVAKRFGVSQSTVQRWHRGHVRRAS